MSAFPDRIASLENIYPTFFSHFSLNYIDDIDYRARCPDCKVDLVGISDTITKCVPVLVHRLAAA